MNNILMALVDLYKGMSKHPFWMYMAWQEIVIRYRRSIIGPFWISLSTAIYILSISLVFSTLFNQELNHYVVYLSIGILVWNYINQTLVEGADTFLTSGGFIKQLPIEKSVFIYQTVMRNVYFFLHNIIILVICFLMFDSNLNLYSVISSFFGLAILTFNLFFASLTLACVCSRFMDLKQIIFSVLQICFLLTPVMWIPTESMRTKAYILEMNPFFHFIDIIRSPILPSSFPAQSMHGSYLYILLFTIGNVFLALVVFARSRNKIAYWV